MKQTFERIYSMLVKEFIQISRDPKMRIMLFVIPLLQTLIFGYAVTTDVRDVKTAIYDEDNTVSSRQLVDAFIHSGYFTATHYLNKQSEIDGLLDKGDVLAALSIRFGFEDDLKSGKTAELQAIIDGTDANTANIIQSYMERITDNFSQALLEKRVSEHSHDLPRKVGIQLETRAWFNDNLESRDFYVPGIIATLMTLLTLTITSMAIVREKEIGTMEQILVTPISRMEFILGKTVPFILISFADVCLILFLALFWFEVPMRGSLITLFIGSGFYLLTTLGIGLIISTVSNTQQQAMMSAFLFYFPAVLLSGFIFPISNMPAIIQWSTLFNPLKYFLVVIRGVFLKGVGWSILWPEMLILAMMGFVIIFIASRCFRKTMT